MFIKCLKIYSAGKENSSKWNTRKTQNQEKNPGKCQQNSFGIRTDFLPSIKCLTFICGTQQRIPHSVLIIVNKFVLPISLKFSCNIIKGLWKGTLFVGATAVKPAVSIVGGVLAVPLDAVGVAAMGIVEGVKKKNPLTAVGFGALGTVGGLIVGPIFVTGKVFGVLK